MDWSLWRDIVRGALTAKERPSDWGSRLEIDPRVADAFKAAIGHQARVILPKPATDYQQQVAKLIRSVLRPAIGRSVVSIVIGPPAFNQRAMPTLCREDILRLKYEAGLAALIALSPDASMIHFAGLSDFGDGLIIDWLRRRVFFHNCAANGAALV